MKLINLRMAKAVLLAAGSLSLWQTAQAGTPVFGYASRDLILCLRKTGSTGGTTAPNNLEVNVGQASAYYGAPVGSSFTITNFTGAQLSNVFDNLNDLSWTVGSCIPAAGDSGDPSIPNRTLWITAPRVDPNVPASPWVRNSATTQGSTASQIKSLMDNAVFYSGTVASNALNNTAKVIAVPVGGGHEAGAFIGTFGNYLNTFQGNVENITPADFISSGQPARSDLYELRPDGTATQPPGKYLGYFELGTDGSLTFFAVTFPSPTLAISLSGGQQTISFPSFLGATYTLYYTNTGGLSVPTTNWPFVNTNITGDGSLKSFLDSSADADRVYRMLVH